MLRNKYIEKYYDFRNLLSSDHYPQQRAHGAYSERCGCQYFFQQETSGPFTEKHGAGVGYFHAGHPDRRPAGTLPHLPIVEKEKEQGPTASLRSLPHEIDHQVTVKRIFLPPGSRHVRRTEHRRKRCCDRICREIGVQSS